MSDFLRRNPHKFPVLIIQRHGAVEVLLERPHLVFSGRAKHRDRAAPAVTSFVRDVPSRSIPAVPHCDASGRPAPVEVDTPFVACHIRAPPGHSFPVWLLALRNRWKKAAGDRQAFEEMIEPTVLHPKRVT
jgi:hypothetical protein